MRGQLGPVLILLGEGLGCGQRSHSANVPRSFRRSDPQSRWTSVITGAIVEQVPDNGAFLGNDCDGDG